MPGRIRECMAAGSWAPAETHGLEASLRWIPKVQHHEATNCARSRSATVNQKFFCPGVGTLDHPTTGSFGGMFAADNRAMLYLIGDSMMGQVATTMAAAKRHNPKLAGLQIRFIDWTVAASSTEGNRVLLDAALPAPDSLSPVNRSIIVVGYG